MNKSYYKLFVCYSCYNYKVKDNFIVLREVNQPLAKGVKWIIV